MWKWIVGGLLAVVVIGFVGCYVLVKRFASGGDSASVTVAATADRVFASLADADSMSVLMGKGTRVSATHHGLVAVGDTLRVETGPQSATAGQRYTWIVSEVVPGRLLVLVMRNDSSGPGLRDAPRFAGAGRRLDASREYDRVADDRFTEDRTWRQRAQDGRRLPQLHIQGRDRRISGSPLIRNCATSSDVSKRR